MLVGQYGARPALLLDAVSYLAIVAAGLSIKTRRGSTEARRAASLDQEDTPSRTWRLRSDPLLGPIVLALGMVVAAVTAINVVDVFFVRQTLPRPLVAMAGAGGLLVIAAVAGPVIRAARRDGGRRGRRGIGRIVSSLIDCGVSVRRKIDC